MNLIDAIKSGNRFRHPEYCTEFEYVDGYETPDGFICPSKYILSDQWEIEEEKIEITKNQLQEAFNKCSFPMPDHFGGFPNYFCRIDLILKELGFK